MFTLIPCRKASANQNIKDFYELKKFQRSSSTFATELLLYHYILANTANSDFLKPLNVLNCAGFVVDSLSNCQHMRASPTCFKSDNRR